MQISKEQSDHSKLVPDQVKIGFTSPEPGFSDVYRIPLQFMQEAAEDAKREGLEIMISSEPSPEHGCEHQIQVMERFLRSGVNALIVHPADLNPIKPALEKAIKSGVCVVLVNLLGTEEYADLGITSYIGFDNYVAGQLSAYATVDYLGGPGCLGRNETEKPSPDLHLTIDWYESLYLSKRDIDVSGNVVIIEGVPGRFTSIQRVKGFRNVIDRFPNTVIKGVYPGDWSFKKASEVTERILNEYPEGKVDVIWAACNDMAFGVVEVLEKNGRLNQKANPDAQGIAVITNDGTPKSLKMIDQRRIIAEVWHGFPEWGWHGIEFAAKAVQGGEVPESHDIVPRIEFSGNVRQFFPHPKLPKIDWRV